ncbi:plasmid pRiA4b ORF-3 family protein [bacterium]|nr:plasmid pRiA4b ORF-3 family protein [bacterium]MBU1615147.1 plasmid pRiA4b ORF-3 family protein [bacterium]
MPKAKQSVYQIKVSLRGIRPPIWRRFQVTGDTSLRKLHEVLQVVMGWGNYHLFQFIIYGTYFGEPHSDYGSEMKDAQKTRLDGIALGEKTKFIYEYDFGDSWEHELLVEKILPVEEGVIYPICLKGKLACPPEDCGGIWGYADLLKIIRDPENEEYEEMRKWAGEDFDPEEFDPDEINRMLGSSGYN